MLNLPIADSQNHSDPPRQDNRSENGDNRPSSLGLRYGAMNYVGEFRVKGKLEYGCGAKFVIQTDRGIELGEPVGSGCGTCGKQPSREAVQKYIDESGPEFYRQNAGRVLRVASPDDVHEHEKLNQHVKDDLDACALTAAQLGLDMKVLTAEHLLGGERIIFYFRSDERIDFRQLVKELAERYQTRIEMRQVGARDEARLVADWEICGRECCCKNFLKKLRPVSMKMAKLQKSTLDPSKVSGRCGRLRCCLRYEQEGYEELNRKLPRKNTRVMTAAGPGTIIDRQVLTQLLLVRTDDGNATAFPLEEIELLPKDQDPGGGRPPRQPDRRERPSQAEKPDETGSENRADTDQAEADGSDAKRSRRGRGKRGRGSGRRRDDAADNRMSESKPAEESGDGDKQRPKRGRRRGRRPRRGGNSDGSGDSKPS